MSPTVLQTMDPVELSYGEALLKGAGIAVGRTEPEFGASASVVEPTPGCLFVDVIDYERAVAVLNDGLRPMPGESAS
jgi:hypothetical protein